MTIRIFIIINLFLSIAYLDELSKEQLDKIDQISHDINKAPNFSLNTGSSLPASSNPGD